MIALMLVGMLTGSAIASSVLAFAEPEGRLWEFMFRLSYLGFVAAMAVTIVIVLYLLWSWLRGNRSVRD